MEEQLSKTPFLVGTDATLADIALFAYTHVAHEGGYDMTKYPMIHNWIQRMQGTKGFCGMEILLDNSK